MFVKMRIFPVVHLTNGHVVSPTVQFKVSDVLDDMSGIHVPKHQQIVTQTDVHDIIFARVLRYSLPLRWERLIP